MSLPESGPSSTEPETQGLITKPFSLGSLRARACVDLKKRQKKHDDDDDEDDEDEDDDDEEDDDDGDAVDDEDEAGNDSSSIVIPIAVVQVCRSGGN